MRYKALIFTLLPYLVQAQISIRQSDWQQEVNYTIDVQLDDVNHTLEGRVKMVYKNNSPQALDSIYFHLYPNAYRSNNTDFAKQQLINGKTDFYFSELSERGRMDSLSFKIDNIPHEILLQPDAPDIGLIVLKKPITSGSSVEISTPFKVKIPGSFSRFGHEEQDYQITQWFPKPAVFDVNGWNEMPYLDQGEFYYEYGSYEVRITLPENYLVAATGELQENSEWSFIRERRDNPIQKFSGIPSASKMKTITFKQDKVHDFAWFASKYFNVEENEIELEPGRIVKSFVYAPQKKISATAYIHQALKHYSKNCGMYPYAHCTVVKGALKAGGGMEYPMITVVSDLGQEVIVHEVGHNWFQGMLGSNERRYPWMDESINSYFEGRTIHGAEGSTPTLEKPKFNGGRANDQIMNQLARMTERVEMHQAIGTHSAVFEGLNYGTMVYGKGAEIFELLHAYLGEQVFYDAFRAYYDKWSFKHPLPGDIKDVFEEVSELDLSWFFDDLINSDNHIDYKITDLKDGYVWVENKGGIATPYSIGFFKNGELQIEVWNEAHEGGIKVPIPAMDFDLVKIDPYELLPENNRRNNTIRKEGIFKKIEPISLQPLIYIENPNRTVSYVFPLVGFNNYNGFMFGVYLGNTQIPMPKFQYALSPMFGTKTSDLNGYGNFYWNTYRNKRLNHIQVGIKSARFAYQPFELYSYNRIAPFVKLNFRNADKRIGGGISLTMRYTNTSFDPHFNEEDRLQVLVDDVNSWNRRTYTRESPDQFIDLTLERKDGSTLNPLNYQLNFQMGMTENSVFKFDSLSNQLISNVITDDFMKLNFTLDKHINYSLKNKGLDIRVFLGTYLKTPIDGLYQYRMGTQGGRYDYTFEQTVMGRSERDGVFSQQVIPTEMNLKLVGNFGNIAGYTAAVNLKTDLPGNLPVNLYLDLFSFDGIESMPNNAKGEKLGYSGGVSLDLIPSIFEIYFPLINSNFITSIQETQGLKKYQQRISFVLNLNQLTKIDVLDLVRRSM